MTLRTSHYALFRPASVLVMVVGLLTIIAMLGATFLLVSRLDRRTAEALAKNTAADPVAQGLVTQVQSKLLTDLHIGGTPEYVYGDTGISSTWFVDEPYTNDWLASSELTSTSSSATQLDCSVDYISRDFGENFSMSEAGTTPVVFRATKSDDLWEWSVLSGIIGVPLSELEPIDTDGDGWADSILFPTGVTNTNGQEYYAAVRVVDLSAMINVNTAGDPNAASLPTSVSPVYIDLRTFLRTNEDDEDTGNESLYDGHNNDSPGIPRGRCGQGKSGAMISLDTYYTQCASRPYNPAVKTPPYVPFSIGDEVFLRWAQSGSSITNLGRLYQDTSEVSGGNPSLSPLYQNLSKRRKLTAFNCSRVLVRNPAPVDTSVSAWDTFVDLSDTTSINNADVRQRIYEEFIEAFYGTTPSEDQKKEAAHFVANLWAYRDGQQTANHYSFIPAIAPRPYAPTGTGFEVFGLKQDLIISEVFAYYKNDTDADGDAGGPNTDRIWGYAIEIWNPTSNPITLSNYQLRGFTADTLLSVAGTTIEANGSMSGTVHTDRIVLYYWHKESGNTTEDQTLFGFPTTFPTNWTEILPTQIDFDGTPKTIRLVHAYPGTPAKDVVVDMFTTDGAAGAGIDIAFNPPTLSDPDSTVRQANVRRDDHTTRYRYNVKTYANMTTISGTNLGLANNLADTDLDGNPSTEPNVYEGFMIPGISGASMVSVNEVSQIYLAGHLTLDPSGTSPIRTSFSNNITGKQNEISRGRLALFTDNTSTTFTAPPVTSAPLGAGAQVPYPATIPQMCFLGEFATVLRPDHERQDDISHESRLYGKVNINTATKETLRRLPWPTSVNGINIDNVSDPTKANQDEVGAIVEYIVAYRDRKRVEIDRDGSGASTTSTVDVAIDYTTSGGAIIPSGYGFKTPGELAIPLAQYSIDKQLVGTTSPERKANYLEYRDALYNAVANLVTVNSDTYAVYIYVQIPHDPNKAGTEPEYEARYLAVIDRSNCRAMNHQPAVLLFTPVK